MSPIASFIYPYFERPKLLLSTLKSLDYFYGHMNIEVIVVDDGSSAILKPYFSNQFNFPIRLITLLEKNGINPSLPINVGARHSRGKILILSSPEVVHTESIFDLNSDLITMKYSDYYVFDVFALTSKILNKKLIETISHSEFLKIFETFKNQLNLNLGLNGYSYLNEIGAWYSHSIFKSSKLNFLSAISKKSFFDLSGFDERYRFGTGFDDFEFRRRIIKSGMRITEVPGGPALHLEHEEVSSRQSHNLRINSNEKIYRSLLRRRYPKNDSWGKNVSFEIKEIEI